MVVALGVLALGLGGSDAKEAKPLEGAGDAAVGGAFPLALGPNGLDSAVSSPAEQGERLASLAQLDEIDRTALGADDLDAADSNDGRVLKTGLTLVGEEDHGESELTSGRGPLLTGSAGNLQGDSGSQHWGGAFRDGLREEGSYQQGVRYGLWKNWRSDGTLRSTGYYANGLRTGVWASYSGAGALLGEMNYQDGSRNGDWTAYSEDGAVLEEGQYSENVATGRWTTYYSGGQVKERGLFVNGLREGHWEFYDDLGLPTLQAGEYRAGIKVQ
jgi:antitoxin component YwqK of YwqJK toxin-antitoxin module